MRKGLSTLMTVCMTLLVYGVFTHAYADLLEKPDSNTLWIEDGKNITSPTKGPGDAWKGSLEFKALPEGNGFNVESPSYEQHFSVLTVPIAAAYPWIIYEITGVEHKDGYKALILPNGPSNCSFAQVSNPQKGYYALNIFNGVNATPDVVRSEKLEFFLYGLKLDFKYIKMVKIPDYYVEVTSAAFATKKSFASGDTLKFTVHLKESAEDVSLRLYDSYGVEQLTFNKQDKLQLQPEGENTKVWTTSVKLESLTGFSGKGVVMVKAIILGGGFSEPLWGVINYPYSTEKNN